MEITNGGNQGGPMQLSSESLPIFREGIALVLSRWSALQMAVENEWGGRDSHRKSDLLATDIFSWFTNSKEPLYIDDLENIIDEGMLSLNTMIEDGSIEEVAEKLMIMHEESLGGNYQSIISLREANPQTVAHSHIRQVVNNDDDDDDDDEDDDDNIDDDNSKGDDDTSNMIVDTPESHSKVDMAIDEPRHKQVAEAEDGWTVVASKRNRGKRN